MAGVKDPGLGSGELEEEYPEILPGEQPRVYVDGPYPSSDLTPRQIGAILASLERRGARRNINLYQAEKTRRPRLMKRLFDRLWRSRR